jgi:hypothetical protein
MEKRKQKHKHFLTNLYKRICDKWLYYVAIHLSSKTIPFLSPPPSLPHLKSFQAANYRSQTKNNGLWTALYSRFTLMKPDARMGEKRMQRPWPGDGAVPHHRKKDNHTEEMRHIVSRAYLSHSCAIWQRRACCTYRLWSCITGSGGYRRHAHHDASYARSTVPMMQSYMLTGCDAGIVIYRCGSKAHVVRTGKKCIHGFVGENLRKQTTWKLWMEVTGVEEGWY